MHASLAHTKILLSTSKHLNEGILAERKEKGKSYGLCEESIHRSKRSRGRQLGSLSILVGIELNRSFALFDGANIIPELGDGVCSGRKSLAATFKGMEEHNLDRTSLYNLLAESRSVSACLFHLPQLKSADLVKCDVWPLRN